ncbi:MAG: hypothetical protein OQK98_12650 [Gammaproteobacteria bacterium]|nr:hypothetical protein [Gammaproteobacteria bacterium]
MFEPITIPFGVAMLYNVVKLKKSLHRKMLNLHQEKCVRWLRMSTQVNRVDLSVVRSNVCMKVKAV